MKSYELAQFSAVSSQVITECKKPFVCTILSCVPPCCNWLTDQGQAIRMLDAGMCCCSLVHESTMSDRVFLVEIWLDGSIKMRRSSLYLSHSCSSTPAASLSAGKCPNPHCQSHAGLSILGAYAGIPLPAFSLVMGDRLHHITIFRYILTISNVLGLIEGGAWSAQPGNMTPLTWCILSE